jgi:biopolymer transport protein ExbB
VITRDRVVWMVSLAALAVSWGQPALAWWNNDWAYRKEITFDLTPTGADIKGSPTDVPVLVRLSLGNFQYFNDTKPDGSDFRFIASDDKTPLKYHIERFDPQSQLAFLWVRVPRLTGGAKTDKIYLYYGNKKSEGAAADAPGTYDANQALVYHFGAPKGSPQDATGYKSEPSSFEADVNPASLIASGAKFGGSQVISVPANGAVHLAAGKGFTVSAWVRFEGAQSQGYIAQLADQGKELVLGIAGTQAFARYADGATPVAVQQSGQLTTGEWHHLALVLGDGHLTLFVDGESAAQANAEAKELGGALTIGGAAAGGNRYTGELDELEVSNTARTGDWIKAAARSQGMVAPLIIYGADAQKDSGGGESYFATTLRSVTVDGWVVIGLLAVMFVAAVLIMATKAFFLNRVARGNEKFLVEFRKMADDPAALEKRLGAKDGSEDADAALEQTSGSQLMSALSEDHAGFGISTLWSLYHHGMRETLKRLEGQPAGADRVRTLSPASIEAIRATLDASLTRMIQRLNSQMVWLTVAIAGGPFLGLLGTVVGVMITFAAIAASGDVNINAIAPGTAAALVATVAGLGVAIPCLFGYNYLNTRVKEISADMHVFVDEFVSRIAETYT